MLFPKIEPRKSLFSMVIL